MVSPGLAVPEEPHQPLSFKFPKRQYGLITLHRISYRLLPMKSACGQESAKVT